MDAKGSDASRATTGKAEGSWWRWTHGKSGSVSSSSDGVPKPASSPSSQFAGVAASGVGGGGSAAPHLHGHGELFPLGAGSKNNSSINHSFSCSSVTHSASPAENMRWQKRAARAATPAPAREDPAAVPAAALRDTWAPMLASTASTIAASSGSPKFFSSFSSQASTRRGTASGKKKAVITPSRSATSSRHAAAKKSSTFGASDPIPHSQIAWSTGPASKRKVTRKEKKSSRVTGPLPGSRTIIHGSRSYRPSLPEFDEDDNTELYLSAFANAQVKASRKSSSPSDRSRSSEVFFKPSTGIAPPASVASTASTSSSTSSTSLSSLGVSPFASSGRSDPVVDCARAVLQDCIRQRHMEYNNARKRAIEGCDTLESKSSGWHYATVSKSNDWSMMSSGSR